MKKDATGPWTMLLGYVLLGGVPVFVKLLRAYGYAPADVVTGRFGLGLLLVALMARLTKTKLETHNLPLLLLRGVLGAVAVLMYFSSVQLAGAAMGTLLNYTYPIWANLIGMAFGHRPGKSFWWHLGLAMLGVLLVVDPIFTDVGLGEALGLCSAVVAGAAVLTIKHLRRTDGELVIIASFSLLGTIVALPMSIWGFLGEPARLTTVLSDLVGLTLIGLVGVLSFLGHVFFTRGYKDTTIQLGTVLSLTVPLVATFFGALLLGERFSARALSGGFLILLACGLVGRGAGQAEQTITDASRSAPR